MFRTPQSEIRFLMLTTRKMSSVLAMLIVWNVLLTVAAIGTFLGYGSDDLNQALTTHSEFLKSGAGFLGASGILAGVYWSYRSVFWVVHKALLGFYSRIKTGNGS